MGVGEGAVGKILGWGKGWGGAGQKACGAVGRAKGRACVQGRVGGGGRGDAIKREGSACVQPGGHTLSRHKIHTRHLPRVAGFFCVCV